MPNRILIVDDDEGIRSELKDFFEDYNVTEAANGEQALRILERANDVDLVILDVMMPGINGIDVLTRIKKSDPNLGIIILTGHSSKDIAIDALRGHADDFIEKPIDIERIKSSTERLLRVRRGESDLSSLDINGKLQRVKDFIEKNCFKKTGLTDAAQAVCLSPKYLSRIFKQRLGLSFSRYRLNIKIEKAKELLTKFGYTVNQVSEKLAYENAESFIRQFKRFVHCTPTEYRKKMQKEMRKKNGRTKKRGLGRKIFAKR